MREEINWTNSSGDQMHAWHWVSPKPRGQVVLVHGMGEYAERYKPFAQSLNEQRISVAAYDQRGHGHSGGQRGHFSSLSDAVKDLDTFCTLVRQPDLPQVLYGHSMGGNLALRYALDHQPALAGLVLSAPWLRLSFQAPKLLVGLGRFMRKIYPTWSQDNQLQVEHLSRNLGVVSRYQEDPLVHRRITAATAIDLMDSGKALLAGPINLPFPTLIMHGTEDQITDPEASAQLAEHIHSPVTYRAWEGLYHELHHEPEQQEVMRYLSNWLNTLLPQ